MSASVCERQVFILRHQALSPQLGRLLPHPTLSITHSGVLQWLPSGSLASWVWVGMSVLSKAQEPNQQHLVRTPAVTLSTTDPCRTRRPLGGPCGLPAALEL